MPIGFKHTEESKRRIREARKHQIMKPVTKETRRKIGESGKGRVPWNKDKQHSEKTIQKMRESHIGQPSFMKGKHLSEEVRQKMSEGHKGNQSRLGIPHSEETKKKFHEMRKGDKNANWKGGITPINKKIRSSREYRLWQEVVFKRDNHTCIWCGKRGNLHADHIKPFALFPELRFAIDNGRTLCFECHKTTETYSNRWKK